jgi:hypothetical protein
MSLKSIIRNQPGRVKYPAFPAKEKNSSLASVNIGKKQDMDCQEQDAGQPE